MWGWNGFNEANICLDAVHRISIFVDSIYGPPAAVSCLCRDTAVRCSVVGPLLWWPARRPGTRHQTTFEIRGVLLTVFVVTWKLIFFRSTSVHSALGASRLCAIQIYYWHWHWHWQNIRIIGPTQHKKIYTGSWNAFPCHHMHGLQTFKHGRFWPTLHIDAFLIKTAWQQKRVTHSPFQFSGLMCSDTLKQSTFKAQKDKWMQTTKMQYSTVH